MFTWLKASFSLSNFVLGIDGFTFAIIGAALRQQIKSGNPVPIERAKCEWLLKNKIFSKILIAKKLKEKGKIKIEYKQFEEAKK